MKIFFSLKGKEKTSSATLILLPFTSRLITLSPCPHFPVISYPLLSHFTSSCFLMLFCGKWPGTPSLNLVSVYQSSYLCMFGLSVTFHPLEHCLLGYASKVSVVEKILLWGWYSFPPNPEFQPWALEFQPWALGAIFPPGWPYQCPQLQLSLKLSECL